MRVVIAVLFLLFGISVAHADSTALGGIVSSAAEGKMEGVLVSATKLDNTITVTVVSDAEGRYRFPDTKLPPGRYTLAIRAIGYALDDAPSATILAGKTAEADLRLAKSGARAATRSSASLPRGITPTNSCKC